MASSSQYMNSIEKLKGSENYSTWKFSMRMLLIHEELWEFVENNVNDEKQKKAEKALARIALSVQPAVIPYIRSAKTAYEAWNNLKKAYEGRGLCRRLGLLRSLFGTKLRDSSSMEDYLNKIKEASHQLSEIESPLDDEFVAVIMLSGLTEDFDPLIMAIENAGTKLCTELVSVKLLEETRRREDKQDSVTALITRKQPRCFKCKRIGHFLKNCPDKQTTGQPASEKETQSHSHGRDRNKPKIKPKDKALVAALSVKVNSDVWYIDSGATNHMCNNEKLMVNNSSNKTVEVSIANGEKLLTAGIGQVKVHLKKGVKTISDAYYVPNLSTNLLSVSTMTKKGYIVTFDSSSCTVYDGSDILATGTQVNGVYQLDTVSDNGCAEDKENTSGAAAAVAGSTSQDTWHRRLGHLNSRSMKLLMSGMATGINYSVSEYKQCIPCIEGKQSRLPFPKKSYTRATDILGLVHTDLCGPIQTPSLSGAKYVLSFIDDYTRKHFTYFLKTKDETFRYFQQFKVFVENETGNKLKILRSDRGGEYMSSKFQDFLKINGIKHQKTIPDSPQQNGVAERSNRTIMEKVRCMLRDAGLGMEFWAEAVNTAVYLKNRSPTKAVPGTTPEEKWSGTKVKLDHLRIFGCIAYVMVKNRKKLDVKSKPCIFVGYNEESKGYRLINPDSPRNCVNSRDVVFIENKFYMKEMSHDDKGDQQLFVDLSLNQNVIQPSESPIVNSDISDDIKISQNTEQRISTITLDDSDSERPSDESDDRLDPTYLPGEDSETESPEDCSYDDASESHLMTNFVTILEYNDPDEPQTAAEALNGPESDSWRKAMTDEYNSFIKNKVWTLTEREQHHKPVSCKWIFKKKYGVNGELLKYKARLVARGYTQKYGVDYLETFSPVVRYSTLRLLIALAAEYDMSIEHLDVKTAFLNAELEETVFMQQPQGFEVKGSENMICKLNKAVYGLKQASKSWYDKINKVLCDKLNFCRLTSEPCVYYRSENQSMMLIALYVDDLIIFCSPTFQGKDKIKAKLQQEFDITDLGPAQQILGMKLSRKGNEISLDQSNYILKLLKKFRMEDCKPSGTPMETSLKLPKETQKDDTYDYRGLVGSLMYIAVCTRPDISYAVSYLSQFNNCYSEIHWKAAKRVLRYLKGTLSLSLIFTKSSMDIRAYADADWASNNIDRRSYTGYVFFLGKSAVSWESRKQRTVALSSTEAEYMALSDTCKEALFIRKLLFELLGTISKVIIFNDNQSAIKLCKNFMFHSRTKHIDIRHHFIKQIVNNGIVEVKYLSTNVMLADVLTKSLCKQKHCEFTNLMLAV